jgi:predicted transcriptional regulator
MCGCLGKHKVNPAFVAEAAENRGYGYEEEDISQRSVKTVITKLLKAGAQTDVGKERQYIFAETATRTYVAYFAEGVK